MARWSPSHRAYAAIVLVPEDDRPLLPKFMFIISPQKAAKKIVKSGLFVAVLSLAFLVAPASLTAQQVSLAALHAPVMEPAAYQPVMIRAVAPVQIKETHRFWDRQNRLLFAGVVALSAADFAVTRANLQNGGRELDPVTRAFGGGTRGLALNFSTEAASMVGLSYVFHKTGHHKLERLTSITNISASGTAVAYDLAHR